MTAKELLVKLFFVVNGEEHGDNEHIVEEMDTNDVIEVTRKLGFGDIASKMENFKTMLENLEKSECDKDTTELEEKVDNAVDELYEMCD
jgi:hypothetical protein